MAESQNLVLEYLRYIRERVDRMADDISELKVRVTGVENGVAILNNRVDRMEMRLARIEDRLSLADA